MYFTPPKCLTEIMGCVDVKWRLGQYILLVCALNYRFEFVFQPLVEGKLESSLVALEYGRWNDIRDCSTEEGLLALSSPLRVHRRTTDVFNEFGVEERNPDLERMRHAHGVRVAQKLVLHVPS